MIAIIGGIIQLVILILSKWFENDAETKKKQQEIIDGLSKALSEGNASAVNHAMQQLR